MTCSISVSEHRVLDSVTLNRALIASQYTDAASNTAYPVCNITDDSSTCHGRLGTHCACLLGCTLLTDWLHSHVSSLQRGSRLGRHHSLSSQIYGACSPPTSVCVSHTGASSWLNRHTLPSRRLSSEEQL